MTTTNLAPAQHIILAKATSTNSDEVDWLPNNVKDGAHRKVLDGTFNRALITNDDTNWFVAVGGYGVLGMKHSDVTPSIPEVDAELEYTVATVEATWTSTPAQAKPRTHDNGKQAEVVRISQCPEGTTIGQTCTAAGWQARTMHSAFAGTFKKKLGPTIVSDEPQGGERACRTA